MSDEIPIQPLTVFLIKKGLKKYRDALDDPNDRLKEFALKADLPFKGVIYLAPQQKAAPGWLDFLQDGTSKDLGRLFNASTRAVMFVRAANRVFAFTFGYGRALLKPAWMERSFGLRVVLNAVDPETLRSVDAKNVQELTVYTRRQASRGSRFEAFGFDTQQDLVGAVTGSPRDQTLAKMLSGSDALLIRSRIEFADLADKCRQVLRAYRDTTYKNQGFAFIDHVQHVKDPVVVEELNTLLVDFLIKRNLDTIHLAPPQIIDWEEIDGFSYTKGREPEPDLDTNSFLDGLRNPDDLAVDRLRRQRIYVHTGATEPTPRWSVYNSLVAEFDRRGRRFVLSGGDWYEIEKSFVDRIGDRVRRIKLARLGLPAAGRDEHEGDYNERAARKRGVYLTDKKCLREDGSNIELCDLYTRKRQFVHVKRWKSSSTLSHLFAQGYVSAEVFISDGKFRDQARKLLAGESSSLASHAPKQQPQPGSYQVVYAIIMKDRPNWRRSLPFFSQLQMSIAAERLSRLGFDVRVERIDVED